MEKDGNDNDGQGDVLAVSCLSSLPGVSSPPPETPAKRTRVAEPSSPKDSRCIRITKLSGATDEFHLVEGELVSELVRRVACQLRVDMSKYAIKLIFADRQLDDDEPVQQFSDSILNLNLSKLSLFRGPKMAGIEKYQAGGVLAPNNCIYFAPSHAAQVLCINTIEGTVEMLGPEMAGDYKYLAGGVLAPNNCIYFAPCHAAQVLCINTIAGTVEMLGPEMAGDGKYGGGGVLAPNNCIYFAPFNARQVLCVNTLAGTVEMLGPEMAGNRKYIEGVVAPNSCIYFAPCDAAQVLCIDADDYLWATSTCAQ